MTVVLCRLAVVKPAPTAWRVYKHKIVVIALIAEMQTGGNAKSV